MLSRLRRDPWVRFALLVLVCACAGWALRGHWEQARDAASALPLWTLPVAVLSGMAGLTAQMLAWRALLAGLGSPLSVPVAARVMFVGQLGKYLPGSVWAFVAQVELARDRDVPRVRGTAATLLAVGVTVAAGLAVAGVALPLSSVEAARTWWWALALAPLLLAGLHPRVVRWGVRLVARPFARFREVAEAGPLDIGGRAMAAALGWTLVAWVPLGLHLWLLAWAVGGDPWGSLAPAVGAYALAWTLGLLVVFAPAGLGVREAVLVVALAPVVDAGAALVAAVLSRLVMTVADVAWAGLSVPLSRLGGRLVDADGSRSGPS
ncbi:lysylphosphatidylglycerol synthase domain-containing protein [Nocardiopsis lambiniae]|uniref:Lysylphosphatidylglycerol synthase domain-containing protein n=1 Tax=Nocardiopsis lambiniae TaxID=3075539 RepID=A0ABU2MG00_9ACTN|nr:lysylphosphatidylglycerol synthase domain-containing protein [Nocardiopsis sp. DSM 44743]MDT0331623.1 lysylphosphatidylglycerol synthase domain-containing protein [Nocardiopsis sp. DSM 44743]